LYDAGSMLMKIVHISLSLILVFGSVPFKTMDTDRLLAKKAVINASIASPQLSAQIQKTKEIDSAFCGLPNASFEESAGSNGIGINLERLSQTSPRGQSEFLNPLYNLVPFGEVSSPRTLNLNSDYSNISTPPPRHLA